MSGGETFDSDFAAATTDRYLMKTVRDQVFNNFGLLGLIESRVGVDRISGGDNILVPVQTGTNTTVDSYAGFDEFANAPVETITNAVFNWKGYYVSIIAQAREILRNQGPEGQINIWMHKVQNALQTLRQTLNSDAYLDGTGNAGKDLLGLALLIDNAGTMGGIARGSNAYWQSIETASGGSLSIDGSTGMLRALHDASPGGPAPGGGAFIDHWLTTHEVVERYHRLLTPGIRFNDLGRGDSVFGELAFKGAPLSWDHACTSGVMFGIASSTFKFYVHPARDFLNTKIAKAEDATADQDAWSQRILVWPEFICIEPRRNVKITGIT